MNKSAVAIMAAVAMSGAIGKFYSPQFNFCGGMDFSSVVSARRKSSRAKSVRCFRKKK